MNTSEFIDGLEHELRLASQRRLRLAAARLPRPPAGAVAFTVVLAVCAAVAVPLLATRSDVGTGHRVAGGGPGQAGSGVVVSCSQTVSGQLAHGWRNARTGTVTVGPLAWVYLRHANPAAINRSHFIQALAVVDPGHAVTVSIPRGERTRLSLDYTSVAPRSRFYLRQGSGSVTFRPCSGSPGQVQFNGGFIVSYAQCAEVDVQVAGEKTTIRRDIPLGRPCSNGGTRVLTGNGIGHATFGQTPSTATRRIDVLLGEPPSKPYSRASACRIDHTAAWPGLEVYFEHGRFVGYAYSLRYQQASPSTKILATRLGLRVGDPVAAGKRLYGSAFHTSTAQGGSWLVKTRPGRIDGYLSAPTGSHRWIASIEAGYVGCPAMTP